jgi:hypothetical protein
MDTKLTIKLDRYVIERAKEYSLSNKKSLSRLIEAYLKSLVNNNDSADNEEIQISPFVKSLSSGVKTPADLDYKKEYTSHLIEKYK